MSKHQTHFGRKFYQCKKTKYWMSTSRPRIRAHQWVWFNYHGKQPKGYHIHHRNDDKSDNRIENLELIDAARHLRHHLMDPIRKEKARIHAEKIRPLAKAWHGSLEGKEWHRAHGKITWIERKNFNITCKNCGKQSNTKTYHQEFCSSACKSKSRRLSGCDDENRKCVVCGLIFCVNKYAKIKCCSRACGAALRNIILNKY